MSRRRRVSRQGQRNGQRNANGSILIAGVILVMGFVALGAPILIFVANVSNQLVLQGQASHIAQQTAAVVDNYRYWLDAPRPGFNQNQALETAEAAAKLMCKHANLKYTSMNIKFEKDAQNNELTVCELKADGSNSLSQANIFGFDMSKYFTGKLNVREANVHSSMPAYAIMHMDAPTVEDQSASRPLGLNRRDIAVIPTFGFYNAMVAGSPNESYTEYGRGVAELQPENFFAMNYYHLKKTDLEYVMGTGNEVNITGWHPGRVIDGKKVEFR